MPRCLTKSPKKKKRRKRKALESSRPLGKKTVAKEGLHTKEETWQRADRLNQAPRERESFVRTPTEKAGRNL